MSDTVPRIVAIRKENVKFEGTVTYKFNNDSYESLNVLENTNLVDGIGGVTWVRKRPHFMPTLSITNTLTLHNNYEISTARMERLYCARLLRKW